MISGIDHVLLAMPPGGEPAAREFYAGVLGMEEESKPPALADRGGCWFASGRCKVHLGVEEGFIAQRKAHPALLAEDLESLAARLMNSRQNVDWDESLEGRRRFFTHDPFGNRLEIIQEGDGLSQR